MAQQINFYDPALRLRRDLLTFRVFLAAVCASMLAVGIGTVWMRHQVQQLNVQARQVEGTLQAQQVALRQFAEAAETLRPDPGLVADLGTTKATLAQRMAALRMLRAGRFGRQEGHSAALLGIARQRISDLWLTGVALDGADMALRGRAVSPALIPVYIGRLNHEPALQGRSFRALKIERPAAEAVAASAAGPVPTVMSGASLPGAFAHPAPFVEFSLTGSGSAAMTKKEPAP